MPEIHKKLILPYLKHTKGSIIYLYLTILYYNLTERNNNNVYD